MVKFLKEEIKQVNAFVILFNGQVGKYRAVSTIQNLFSVSKIYSWAEKHDQAL